MTKYILVLIICSMNTNTCIPPQIMPTHYSNIYECFLDGYEQSKNKMIEIGKEEVSKHRISIRFTCREVNVI